MHKHIGTYLYLLYKEISAVLQNNVSYVCGMTSYEKDI